MSSKVDKAKYAKMKQVQMSSKADKAKYAKTKRQSCLQKNENYFFCSIMESYKINLSEKESHLSDFKPSEM